MTNLLLTEALSYARRGWYVFPCREKPGNPFSRNGEMITPTEKQPYVTKGLNDATLDEDQIVAWWTKWPNAMIGVNAGKSGLFVVDIDKKHVNGLDTFVTWNINDSAGLHSFTPSGGVHIVFTGSGKSSTSAETGIDTRGEGGYFIVPPSKILEGDYTGEYKTFDDWGRTPGSIPDGLMSKLFPDKTIEYVRGNFNPADGEKKVLSRKTLNFIVMGASQGERNFSIFSALADFAGCGYTKEQAKESVYPVAHRIGIGDSEFEQTLNHAYSKPRTSSIPDSIQEKIAESGKKVATRITSEEQIVMEEIVIACMLVENNLIPSVNDILGFDDFQGLKNRLIYKAISRLYNAGAKVDYVTVSNEIAKETDKVSLLEISKLINQFYLITDNVITYANIIKEKSSLRKIDAVLSDKEKYLSLGNLVLTTNAIEKAITDIAIAGGAKSTAIMDGEQAVDMVADRTRRIMSGEIQQLETGFIEYDYQLGGIYSNELIVCAARAGDGKCLSKGTLVIMFDGSMKKVEDIIVGDKLMGVDSKPRMVLSLSNGRTLMYTIKQNRSQNYTVTGNHVLSLKQSNNNSSSTNGKIVNISVNEYVLLSKKAQDNLKGYKVSVEFPKKELPIEPYFLGIWLGDGSSYGSRITSADYEVAKYIKNYAQCIGMTTSEYCKKGTTAVDYNIVGGMRVMLKKLSLLENKHIPFSYLTSDREDRLQLLAGILDTDGNAYHGGFELTQKNKELIKQIKWLADSLGFRTSKIRETICTIKSIGFSGTYYKMTIHGDVSEIPVKIERKKIAHIEKRINQSVTGIEVVEAGIGEYYGFELDGDSLFLLEDFTVTHNSAMSLSIANHVGLTKQKGVLFFSLEMSTHESICRLVCQMTGLAFKDVYRGKLTPKQWEQYKEATSRISAGKIYFDEGFGMTVPEIRSKIRKMMEKDIKLIVIDQLEQIKGYENQPAYIRFDNIAYDIKALTKEFEVPIILNHQLNRNSMDRKLKNPEPQMSDLNQAGEKPANQVWVISHKRDESKKIIQSKVMVLKNRNGPTLEFAVVYVGDRMLFSNPTREEEKQVFRSPVNNSDPDADVCPF